MYQTIEPPGELATEVALRGLTLEERLRIARPRKCLGKIDKHCLERVRIWRSWFTGTDNRNAWTVFLAQEGLSERKLIYLDSLTDHERKLPDWWTTLGRIFEYLQQTVTKSDSRLSVCENLATPLANFAWHELVNSTSRPYLRLLSPPAALELQQSFRKRLARTGNEAARWEILAADADRGGSMSLKPSAGVDFHDCFFYAGVSTAALHFLQNYPALARLWAVQIRSWLRFLSAFLRHANTFAHRDEGKIDNLEIIGPHGSSRGRLISRLESDLSDPHGGNKAVVRVRFEDDEEWFYKPRPGLHERAWFELLGWINGHGFARPFQVVNVVCKDRHCWMESVRRRPFRNRKEAEDYCFRLGALTCLIHVLRGVDFHPANVVAVGDQPVAIDCETLLHPATALPEYARAEDDSVKRTGILRLIGRLPLDNVVAGFSAMHDFLQRRSVSGHLRHWRSRIHRIPGRDVYRPTVDYYKILQGSIAPSVLTNGLERSLCLRAACRIDCASARRARAEAQALQNADIPAFRSRRGKGKIDLSRKTLVESIATMRASAEVVPHS